MSLTSFIQSIDDAVTRGTKVPQQVENVRNALVEVLRDPAFLPAVALLPDTTVPYARRLIHRDPRFSIVAMVWAPGQATPIHDHSGVWCVEGVYAGCISVTKFDMLWKSGDVAHFVRHPSLEQEMGCAGSLIPPVEYHTIENSCSENPAVTVHIYGGELEMCRVFLPREDGDWDIAQRQLSYTDELIAAK
jgi:3-mercaptopropionate dioxygenase